ncbi:dynamin family protein [Paenibacillus puerhi]|uniref:dynamin family protein n=1 Tax=Paenibacillus puerhi TaxID=2692622 RepID=UPI001359960D|nr:dynamin family protein [Paenibacillus puerhi]
MLDLRSLREQRLQLTVDQFAERLGLPVEKIIELEHHPERVDVALLMKIGQVFGLSLETLLQASQKPAAFEVKPVYRELRERQKRMDDYLRSKINEMKLQLSVNDFQSIMRSYEAVSLDSSKPVISLLGPSDAGKSTMINALLGQEVVLSQWTPTTSAAVFIKHIEDKPAWMGEDDVWIFRAEGAQAGFNIRQYKIKSYCHKHLIKKGDRSLLTSYTNRHDKGFHAEVDTAIVFLDAPILQACDLADLPGFGTDTKKDTDLASRARGMSDAMIFLCQSNAFFNKEEDIIFAKTMIQQLPVIRNSEDSTFLSNLFIVASQARIVGESQVDKIFERGYTAIANQLSDELVRATYGVGKAQFSQKLRSRFFSYEVDSAALRAGFEQQLLQLLETILPAYKQERAHKTMQQFKERLLYFFRREIVKYEEAIQDRNAIERSYEEMLARKDSVFSKINAERDQLIQEIEEIRERNLSAYRAWESQSITVSAMEKLIKEKGYNKKNAPKLLPTNVTDLYHAKLQEMLQQSTADFQQKADRYLNNVEGLLNGISKQNMDEAYIPFDMQGILAGGLAGLGVLGGLGVVASGLGNLGGYILVAKGVSLLSAAGISVGGTAAAASAVAAIGGPITLGIGLAVGIFLIGRAIFGDSWQTRLAKELKKKLDQEQVAEKYMDQIDAYWNQTKEGIRHLSDVFQKEYEDKVMEKKNLLLQQDSEDAERQLRWLKEGLDYFEGMPQ